MKKILAIDSSGASASVALLHGSELITKTCEGIRQHASVMLPMIEDVLSEGELSLQDLDCLAFARGPGSFTGVRIAASITQGLALACDLPVLPVSSLQAIAWRAFKQFDCKSVVACIDARMNQLYWARFNLIDDRVVLEGAECVDSIEVIERAVSLSKGALMVGMGLDEYLIKLKESGVSLPWHECVVEAEAVAQLAMTVDAVDAGGALPVYVRDNVVHGGR